LASTARPRSDNVTVGVGTKWSAITRRAASSCSDVGARRDESSKAILLVAYFIVFVLPSKVDFVHSLVGVMVVATLAFTGTMFDNFFAFAAQLASPSAIATNGSVPRRHSA